MNADNEQRLFGPVEHRLFRYTAVLMSSVVLIGLAGLIVWILAKLLAVFYNLLLPLSMASILALVLYPVVDFLQTRLRLPRVVAIGVLFVGFAAGLVGFVFLLVPTMMSQAIEIIDAAPGIISNWRDSLARYFPGPTSMVSARLESGNLDGLLPALDITGKTIMSYLGLLVGLGFVPLFLFFTLLSGRQLHGQASEVLSVFNPETQKKGCISWMSSWNTSPPSSRGNLDSHEGARRT
jgi:predicted PurR-regulated permease PerM